MKDIFKCFVFVILGLYLTTAAVSCKDKTEPAPDPEVFMNEMIVDGVNYNLGHGEILRLERFSSGVYYAPMYIVTDNYELTDNSITGIGHAMEITVVTNRSDYIAPGTYTFKDDIYTSSVLTPNTFIAGVFMDWNFANFEVSGFYEGKSGSLTVEYQDGIYTFSIDLIADLYDIGHAGAPPSGEPIKKDVVIKLTFKGAMAQKYFG